MTMPLDYCAGRLPASLKATRQGEVGVLWLTRGGTLDDETILGIETYFSTLAGIIKTVVLASEGEDLCLGLAVSAARKEDTIESLARALSRQRSFERIQFGKVPVVAVLRGAVIGAGLELAAAAHVRVAERSAYYKLGEGLGQVPGGCVGLTRLIGPSRVMDMMLTGRTYSAEEGQTMGLSTYLVNNGSGVAKGLALADTIARNRPIANCSAMHLLPRVAMDPAAGHVAEELVAALARLESQAAEQRATDDSGTVSSLGSAFADGHSCQDRRG